MKRNKMYISDSILDQFIEEDVPYLDLTSSLLDIEEQKGTIKFIAREKTCVCGTEEVKRILKKFDIEVISYKSSGTFLDVGDVMLEAKGKAKVLHVTWKICVNILENASGIATRTKKFIEIAKEQNSNIEVLTSRKNFPGTKKLAIKAIVSGGALPHRLGLSESVLVFEEHMRFIGGLKGFLKRIECIKKRAGEKKIIVEAHNTKDAIKLAKAGVDVIQLDKFTTEDMSQTIKKVKEISKDIKIGAAGGVNLKNVKEIAQTGVDFIITSSLFFGKPSDIKADLQMSA